MEVREGNKKYPKIPGHRRTELRLLGVPLLAQLQSSPRRHDVRRRRRVRCQRASHVGRFLE